MNAGKRAPEYTNIQAIQPIKYKQYWARRDQGLEKVNAILLQALILYNYPAFRQEKAPYVIVYCGVHIIRLFLE
jgi:hypothetical protein